MRLLLACSFGFLMNFPLWAKPLLIGTLAYAPPFEEVIDEKGHFSGFDIDIMNEICRRLKVTCHYKPLVFSQLFGEIQSQKIDLAIAGIAITEARQLLYLFSLPYLASKGDLLVNANTTIHKIKDLEGQTIGVESGSLFKTMADTTFTRSTIREYDTHEDLLKALSNHSIAAIFFDQASAEYLVDNNNGLFQIIGDPISFGLGYGIMTNQANGALMQRINNALIEMENDGTYLSLFKQYFDI